jgi:hypothetical protein
MVVFALYFGSFDEEKGLEIKGFFCYIVFTSQINQLCSCLLIQFKVKHAIERWDHRVLLPWSCRYVVTAQKTPS